MRPLGLMINSMLILLLIQVSYGADSTRVIGGNIHGLWTEDNSPYLIYGNCTIPVDSTLTIEPGVTVEFQGHFSLEVQGRMLAVGTASDSILFTVNDTTGFSDPDTSAGGWNGIHFTDTPQHNDSSKIIHCILEFGKAVDSVWFLYAGGAITIIQFDKVLISGCLLKSNTAGGIAYGPIGGALYFHKSDILLMNNTFENNRSIAGGAIYFDESNPTFINNTFKGNFAVDGGGLAIGGASFPSFTDDKFLNNTAASHGGGLVFSQPSLVTCNNILFSGNKAVWAGAIGVMGGELHADDCIILGNKAELWGGGIAGDYATLYLKNCTFTQDTSYWGSGGLHMDHAVAEINNCKFNDNRAIFGSGSHGVFSQIKFEQCNFLNNLADGGAGMHLENSDLDLLNCLFQGNQAITDRAGAIDYIADTTIFRRHNILKIVHSKFLENSANTNGGAVRIEQINSEESLVNVEVDHSEFRANKADVYGGLRIEGKIKDFTVSNCLFTGNTSKRYVAGAGFITGSQGNVFNSIFASNYSVFSDSTATAHGASLGNGAEVEFFNCTFFDTSDATGVGISVRNNSKAIVTNSILWKCGERPISIVTGVGSGCAADINYCNIQNGIDSIFVSDSLSTFNWGAGNINTDPLFVDAVNMDFHLQSASPCIGTGVNCIMIDSDWHCSPTSDMDGNPRPVPQGSNADMGAYENVLGVPVNLENDQLQIPGEYKLEQNFPNPFNPKTAISYQLPIVSKVDLSIYNILGQKVAMLVSEKQPAGTYKVEWNAIGFASGVYLFQLKTDKGFVQTRKLVLMK